MRRMWKRKRRKRIPVCLPFAYPKPKHSLPRYFDPLLTTPVSFTAPASKRRKTAPTSNAVAVKVPEVVDNEEEEDPEGDAEGNEEEGDEEDGEGEEEEEEDEEETTAGKGAAGGAAKVKGRDAADVAAV